MSATPTKSPAIHAFNTGRLYTDAGQRIGWAVLSTGNVAMVDIDRGIDYTLDMKGDQPSDWNVLHAYDHNSVAPYNRAEYLEALELRSALGDAAKAKARRAG